MGTLRHPPNPTKVLHFYQFVEMNPALAPGGFVELGEVRFLGNFKHQVTAHQTRKNSPLPRTGSAHVLTLSNPAGTAPLIWALGRIP
jgi:hypothetical protein